MSLLDDLILLNYISSPFYITDEEVLDLFNKLEKENTPTILKHRIPFVIYVTDDDDDYSSDFL
jgi:hypothetical protein